MILHRPDPTSHWKGMPSFKFPFRGFCQIRAFSMQCPIYFSRWRTAFLGAALRECSVNYILEDCNLFAWFACLLVCWCVSVCCLLVCLLACWLGSWLVPWLAGWLTRSLVCLLCWLACYYFSRWRRATNKQANKQTSKQRMLTQSIRKRACAHNSPRDRSLRSQSVGNTCMSWKRGMTSWKAQKKKQISWKYVNMHLNVCIRTMLIAIFPSTRCKSTKK